MTPPSHSQKIRLAMIRNRQDMVMINFFISEQGSQNMFHKIMVVKAIIMKRVTVIFVIFHIVLLANSVLFHFRLALSWNNGSAGKHMYKS